MPDRLLPVAFQLYVRLLIVLQVLRSAGCSTSTDPENVDEFSRALQCACTTEQCKDSQRISCVSSHKCYTQFLENTDGSDPYTRGCISGNSLILCDNLQPSINIIQRKFLPYVKCCDGGDFCNTGVIETPRFNHVKPMKSPANATAEVTFSTAPSQYYEKQGVLRSSVVIIVVLVGLVLLSIISAVGYHVLHMQSVDIPVAIKRRNNQPDGDIRSEIINVPGLI